ncbi:MAG TPA: alpha/beta hydrolase, partial [Nitrolancea sp.]|nr:alpha/beta hydrolase [Nitrolancea sp.]
MAITERVITTSDGARIAYEVNGDGPPVLALHGVLVGTSNWIHQMLRLPRFRWVVPALRGHGKSSPAGEHPTIEQAAFDAVAVLDSEGIERAVVVGNSLGATVG